MSSYISMSQAIGYASPFLAAFLADACIGDYNTIVVFTVCCYIPGLFIISSLAIPGIFHLKEFPLNILMVGTHFLFPLGFGAAKTLYGVYYSSFIYVAPYIFPILSLEQICPAFQN